VTYYRDADGDGYGDPNNSKISCSGAPAGYITNNGDCCDTDPIAYPGSGHYSGYPNYGPRAGGCPNPSGQEYDYNCDGVNKKIVAGTYFNLNVITSCNQTLACDSCGCYCNDVQGGWIGSIPACGQSGAFTICQPGGSSCVETTAQSYVVYCQWALPVARRWIGSALSEIARWQCEDGQRSGQEEQTRFLSPGRPFWGFPTVRVGVDHGDLKTGWMVRPVQQRRMKLMRPPALWNP
jgi:hypothetical protein